QRSELLRRVPDGRPPALRSRPVSTPERRLAEDARRNGKKKKPLIASSRFASSLFASSLFGPGLKTRTYRSVAGSRFYRSVRLQPDRTEQRIANSEPRMSGFSRTEPNSE